MTVRVRSLQPGEEEAWCRVKSTLDRQSDAVIGQAVRKLAAMWRESGFDWDALLVAEYNGEIIGKLYSEFRCDMSAQIFWPVVRPGDDFDEVGRSLIDCCLKKCREKGMKKVEAILTPKAPHLDQIVELYLSLGFRLQAEKVIRAINSSQFPASKSPFLRYIPFELQSIHLFASVLSRTYEGTLDRHSEGDEKDSMGVLRCFQANSRFDPNLWFIGYVDNEPIGIILSELKSNAGGILYMGVIPKHRGLGYGRALIEKALQTMGDKGVERVWVSVDINNKLMLNILESLHFESVSSQWVYWYLL
jgi:ribosomal protein S18 acetylase RimI-like enzyme